MVQKSLSLNKNKQSKGAQKNKTPKVSKVDILKKKKKKDASDTVGAAATAFIRKCGQKTEANVAAKAQVEGNANLDTWAYDYTLWILSMLLVFDFYFF